MRRLIAIAIATLLPVVAHGQGYPWWLTPAVPSSNYVSIVTSYATNATSTVVRLYGDGVTNMTISGKTTTVWIAGAAAQTNVPEQDPIFATNGVTLTALAAATNTAVTDATNRAAGMGFLLPPSTNGLVPTNRTLTVNGSAWTLSSNGVFTIAGGGFSFPTPITTTTNYVLSITQSNLLLVVNSTGTVSVTLPTLTTLSYWKTEIVKRGTGTLIATNSVAQISDGAGVGGSIYNDQTNETWATVSLLAADTNLWVLSGHPDGTWTTTP